MRKAGIKPGPGFQPARSLGFYAQRLTTWPPVRERIGRTLARHVSQRHGLVPNVPSPTDQPQRARAQLRNAGLGELQYPFEPACIAEIRRFLLELGRPEELAASSVGGVAEYDLDRLLRSSAIIKLANTPWLVTLVSEYLGCKPTWSGIAARWSFPPYLVHNGPHATQAFHRDRADWKCVSLLIYLSDVDSASGPHQYVAGTHMRAPVRSRPSSLDEVCQEYGAERIKTLIGGIGFAFIIDAYGLHRAKIPETRPRLALQISYSIGEIFSYRYVAVPTPVPGLDPYINRLFLSTRDGRAASTISSLDLTN